MTMRHEGDGIKRLNSDEIRAVRHGNLGIPNGITVIVAGSELVKHFPNQEFPYGAIAIVCQDYALPVPELIRVLLKGSNDEILVRWRRCLL